MLQPDESQTLTISFQEEDMASFDTYGTGYYVLEAGSYSISIRSDAHNIIDEQTYTVTQTVVYDESNTHDNDIAAATVQFGFAEGAEDSVSYLSRKDGFANFAEVTAAPATHSMAAEDKAVFMNNSNYVPETDPSAAMPRTGARNGLTLVDMRGLEYDDPQWDSLLDQMSVGEMVNLIAYGGYGTHAADSVGKVPTSDCDGPVAINNNFTGNRSIGYPCSVTLANTWNVDLAHEFGEGMGKMAAEMDVTGWYGPAINTHRSAFGGRNFEYFSEDPLLAGIMASQAVQGACTSGVYPFLKHFAMNEQETNRWEMLCTWSTEQAIREIYLKPFEICVKDNAELGGAAAGYPLAIMSSYNYIGTQWAGGCGALLNTVLRDEWGFVGMVLTDYFASFGYMNATQGIYNGNDICLAVLDFQSNYVTDTSNPVTVQKMRTTCHNILYTTANSRAHDPTHMFTGLMDWQVTLIIDNVILAIVLVAVEAIVLLRVRKMRRNATAT